MDKKEYDGVKWAEMVARSEINPTMSKKLFISVCPTGALFSRKQNPAQPHSPEEIAQGAIEAYEEGACLAHIHTRDELGNPSVTIELLQNTLDPILKNCPDMIIQPSVSAKYKRKPEDKQYSYETVKPMVDDLKSINPKYMESTIFTPVSYFLTSTRITLASEENAVKTIEMLEENGIKPEFMAHNWEGIMNVKEWLIKPDILKKPYFISMGPGMHNAAETYPDPWGLLYVLGMMKMMPEDTVIGLSAGGRNWLPLTAFAILMGVDFVRVGLEDHLWMYPHKNEKIDSNREVTRKIAAIAKEFGREIGTPQEARDLLRIS
ncbi:3-keto-5-aminohexanoate cleavage protein [Acidobacteriota bacterium]